jgi:hypothetical protein
MMPSLISGWRHRGNNRFAHAREPLVVTGIVGAENVDVGLVRHLLDVGTGGKRLVGAGDEDAADTGIGVEGLDRAEELVHQRDVERVQGLRPVETDDADAAASFDNDGFAAHGCPWLAFSRAMLSCRFARGKPMPLPARGSRHHPVRPAKPSQD